MVKHTLDNDEVVDNGLQDEVVVNNILEDEMVEVTMKSLEFFMVLKQRIPIMLREFILKSI